MHLSGLTSEDLCFGHSPVAISPCCKSDSNLKRCKWYRCLYFYISYTV